MGDINPSNPYPITHPQWKHFGLGVLVWNGKLKEEDVVSWQPDSPAARAFAEGYWAAEREALRQQAAGESYPEFEGPSFEEVQDLSEEAGFDWEEKEKAAIIEAIGPGGTYEDLSERQRCELNDALEAEAIEHLRQAKEATS